MPQLAALDIKAHQIRKGDRVISVARSAHPVSRLIVEKIQDKTKLVHIKTPQFGRPFTIPRDADVQVEREVPTDEEELAALHEYQLRTIQQHIADAPGLLADAKEGLLEDLDGSLDRLGWPLSCLIKARVNQDLWRRVEKTAIHYEFDLFQSEDISLLTATREVCDFVKNDLCDLQFSIRGTSVLHNVVEDCMRQAKAVWVRYVSNILVD